MATIFNNRKVATNAVSEGDKTIKQFTYKGFSSRQTTKNFKLYDIDLVKQDIINHFYISNGEKLENPEFGTVIWDMLFEQFTEEVKTIIRKNVEEIINYDPRISVQSVIVDATPQGMRIEAEIIYVPFNVNERMTLNFDRENNIIN